MQHQLQRDRLKIMKYKQDNLQVAECTFKPKIIRKKSTGSKNVNYIKNYRTMRMCMNIYIHYQSQNQ